jgi:hypothetical protein
MLGFPVTPANDLERMTGKPEDSKTVLNQAGQKSASGKRAAADCERLAEDASQNCPKRRIVDS